MPEPLLDVRDLSVDYLTENGDVHVLHEVSLSVAEREFVGIVGESGCGKSTLLFAIAQLLSPPGEVVGGEVVFIPLILLMAGFWDPRRAKRAELEHDAWLEEELLKLRTG